MGHLGELFVAIFGAEHAEWWLYASDGIGNAKSPF